MKKIYPLLITLILFSCQPDKSSKENWVPLFNGTNLEGWTPKFNHMDYGLNYKNTFRVKDSILMVCYDDYDSISDEFGHLFYEKSFSHYKIRVEYRFRGNQPKGGQAWAYRNNGIMLHCQNPETMGTDQAFPVSLEAQLLGGNGTGSRPTGNLCTPGTHVEMNGKLITNHCINSTSETFNGDEWIEFEAVVLGDSLFHHIVNGDTVISYSNAITGGDYFPEDAPFPEGFALSEGFISIQAESAPTEFRKIELLDLSN